MSITDELRAWLVRKFPVIDKEWHEEFTAIADRIDAEHESACAEAYGNGVMSVPIALDESAWVKLPVDADGVPIRVGDVMEWVDIDGEVTVTCTVEAVGVGCFFAWDNANGRFAQKCANVYRHHHEPTVEDVLREFAQRWDDPVHYAKGELVEQYAARLRLAGDAE